MSASETSILRHVSTLPSRRAASVRGHGVPALVAALTLAALPFSEANAYALTATQTASISGFEIDTDDPPDLPDPREAINESFNGNATSVSDYDFSTIRGVDNGSVEWFSQGDSNGTIRLSSELGLGHVFDAGGYDFTDIKIDASQTVSYSDTVSTSDSRGRFFRFETVLTGDLSSTVNYGNPETSGATTADYRSRVSFSSNIASDIGGADQVVGFGQTNSIKDPGAFEFGEQVDESDDLSVTVAFEDVAYFLAPVVFSWTYTDSFEVDIQNIDAGSIDLQMMNDLSNTIITRASVYDINGVLLPDARVQSESGFVYDPLDGDVVEPPNPVPVASSALLVLLGCLGLSVRRRKSLAG